MKRKTCRTCRRKKALRAFDRGGGTHGHVDTCRECNGYGAAKTTAPPASTPDPEVRFVEVGDVVADTRRTAAALTWSTIDRVARETGSDLLRAEANGQATAFLLLTGEPVATVAADLGGAS